MKKTKVYMALLSMGDRSDGQCYFLRHIEKEYKDFIELVYPEECRFIVGHDAARNHHVEQFLKTDCDVIWFLDADILPSVNVMEYFTQTFNEWEVAVGVCPLWMCPDKSGAYKIIFNVYKSLEAGFIPYGVRPGIKTYLDAAGTGCMFIKRHVFDSLEKPYFSFDYNAETRGRQGYGEDLYFCNKIGPGRVFVNMDALCEHYKQVGLLEMNNFVLGYAQDAMHAYKGAFLQQLNSLRSKPSGIVSATPKIEIISG